MNCIAPEIANSWTRLSSFYFISLHFPCGANGKELACNAGDIKKWVRSLHGEGPLEQGMTTHSSVLAWRIPMDRGAWQAAVHGRHKESDTTERLRTAHGEEV